jgi:hypothetical protein
MDNLETKEILGSRLNRTKINKNKNTSQKNKNMSNTEPTKNRDSIHMHAILVSYKDKPGIA